MPAFEFSRIHNAFTKRCSKCSTLFIGAREQQASEKIFADNFNNGSRSADGFLSQCKKCTHDLVRRNRGIVGEYDIDKMLEAQDNKCAICDEPILLKQGQGNGAQLDHDPKTGEVRGMLCIKCNRGLDQFQDSITNLQRAIAYLIAFSCTPQ